MPTPTPQDIARALAGVAPDTMAPDTGYFAPIAQGIGNLMRQYQQMPSWTEQAQDFVNEAAQLRNPLDLLKDPAYGQFSSGIVGPATIKSSGGITAYHGSPHDFERFDLSKIGTGEGAQAYGHGLYFAGNEDVAGAYRRSLTQNKPFRYGDESAPTWESGALDYLNPSDVSKLGMAGAVSKTIGDLKNQAQFYRETYANGDPSPNLYDNAAARLARMDPAQIKQAGRMYQVNINADPEHFLDWDKPLSEQPQAVRDLLKSNNVEMSHQVDVASGQPAQPTGRDIYYALTRETNPADAIKTAREAGIPGIRYLDQGSRKPLNDYFVSAPASRGDYFQVMGPGNISHGKFPSRASAAEFADSKNAEGQTHNYVVFDDKMIDILKKYGLAGLGIGGAGAVMPADDNSAMKSIMTQPPGL